MALRFAAFCSKNCVLLCLLFFTCRASSDVDGFKEKTLAMIKPDGVDGKYVDTIKEIILDAGFSITKEIERQLDEVTVKSFYAEHASKSFFSNLFQYMTSGPVRIMVIEKENAIADWRALIGPTDSKKAKATHPDRLVRRLIQTVCELCVDSTQKEIVRTVQIHHNLLPERYLFSFRSHL